MKTIHRYELRRATCEDLCTVSSLIAESGRWLNDERGSKAWPREGFPNEKYEGSLAAGETWLLIDNGNPIATMTLDFRPDPEFAAAGLDPSGMLILHRLAVSRDPAYAGKGHGYVMLDCAVDIAVSLDCPEVWFNVNRTAERLHRYYLRYGARHMATTEAVAGRRSGWLGSIPARTATGLLSRMTAQL